MEEISSISYSLTGFFSYKVANSLYPYGKINCVSVKEVRLNTQLNTL